MASLGLATSYFQGHCALPDGAQPRGQRKGLKFTCCETYCRAAINSLGQQSLFLICLPGWAPFSQAILAEVVPSACKGAGCASGGSSGSGLLSLHSHCRHSRPRATGRICREPSPWQEGNREWVSSSLAPSAVLDP